MRTNTKNYYNILGVAENASHKTIRKAYRRLISQYSPLADERTKQVFKDIETAYSVLSDKQKRAAYNKQLKEPKAVLPLMNRYSLFDSFFDMNPFRAFDDDFFGCGLKKKHESLFGRNFFDIDTDPSSDEEKESAEKPYTKSFSTTSSTVIKDGVRTTKTKKTVITPDGKKDVKIIKEVEGKDGKVKRSVKHLENGKQVKAITTEEDNEVSPLFGRMYSTYTPILTLL